MSRSEFSLLAGSVVAMAINIGIALSGYEFVHGQRFFWLGFIAMLAAAAFFFGRRHDLSLRAKLFCSFAFLPFVGIAAAVFNVLADRLPALPSPYRVVHKSVEVAKGKTLHKIVVALPSGGAFLYLSEEEYRGIEPGKSHVVLTLHRGALGEAWFKGYEIRKLTD